MIFQDMYRIIFLFGKIYFSMALTSVCTGRSHFVITRARAYGSFHFDVKNVKKKKLIIVHFLSELQERRSSSNSLERCVHIP